MPIKSWTPWSPKRALRTTDTYSQPIDQDICLDALARTHEALLNLVARFDTERAAILNDPDLSESGRSKKVAELRAKFEREQTLKNIASSIKKGEQHAAELTKRVLPKPPRPDSDDFVAAVDFCFKKYRALDRLAALEPGAKLRVVEQAIQKCSDSPDARQTLAWALENPDLLAGIPGVERTIERVSASLLRAGNRDTVLALDELLGSMDHDGRRDPASGALPTAKFALSQTLSYLREMAPDGPRDRLAAVTEAGGRVDSDGVRLPGEAAKVPSLYRAGKELASERNVPLILVDGVTETSVGVSPNPVKKTG